MDTIRNFSMGLTAKSAVWFAYTTVDGQKVASGKDGPAHAVSFAFALEAAGIVPLVDVAAGAADDLADTVKAQSATIAALRLYAAKTTADMHAAIAERDATIADLRRQLADLQHAAIAAESGPVATVTPIRKADKPEAGKVYAITGPKSIASGATWGESEVGDDPVSAHLAALAGAVQSEVTNG